MFNRATLRAGAAALACLAIVGCKSTAGLAPNATAVTVASELPPPDVVTTQAQQRAYRLGAFDSLTVEVFGAKELDREVQVDSLGRVNLPLVGQLQVGGKTTSEVAELIEANLRGRYIKRPQVTVNLKEARSQQVTVDGAVRQPGVYPVLGRMTLQQAIATARGTDEFAKLDRVVIFRTVNNQRMAAMFSLRDIRQGLYADPEIYGSDVVVVGENNARRLLRDVSQTFPVFAVFTPLLNSN